MTTLVKPSSEFKIYKEIAVHHAQHVHEYYNKLSLEEKIFIYYMQKASTVGNIIASDQLHADAREIIKLFELIIKNQELLQEYKDFVEDAKVYLVYLWTSHSQYFNREDQQNKRTPGNLELKHISPLKLVTIFELIGVANAKEVVHRLHDSIFEASVEPTTCVPDSIEKSAVNMYSPDFTESDYQSLPADERSYINTRFYKDHTGKPAIETYSAKGRCSQELTTAIHWLKKACYHAEKYTVQFDMHVVKSLQLLIQFLETGEEKWFREHSIEWLNTKSRIDYTFGFIESYDDPKAIRSTFAAEVTIKTIDIDALSFVLPSIETSLPFPDAYKRERFDVPNASINMQVFGTGDYGPMKAVLAYCLPNYEDIRSQFGSKQIIYHHEKGIGALLNPELNLELSYSNKQVAWIKKHDPELKIVSTADTLLTILHETIGHASGKLAMHTFKEGDLLTIENVEYEVGTTIPVTTTNLKEFLHGYDQTIEELRAEIIALYVATNHFKEIIATGIVPELQNTDTRTLQELFVSIMTQTAYRRLLRQPENVTVIAGDHSRANTTITHYLLSTGAIKELREEKVINGITYIVPTLEVANLEYALEVVKNLMIQVQTIKSTGDGQAADKLIKTYGSQVLDKSLPHILKTNKQAVMGNIKATATIYPQFEAIKNNSGEIKDIVASWPKDIFDQEMHYTHIALSRN